MAYQPDEKRYDGVPRGFYRRCGRSGILLPAVSIGCWHNFGGAGTDAGHHGDEAAFHENCRRMLFKAFDLGITHFDLANNYGPPPGSAEERVGRILKDDFAAHRDELIIASKAGYTMWPGPYGDWGSRKYLLASLDASLKRLKLDYVDIFYSHRPDPGTPIEETMGALDQAVKSGKALYAAISNYRGLATTEALAACDRGHFAKPILHQARYSMLDRWVEADLLPVTEKKGLGVICFSPLAQGLLSDKYLAGIPKESRAGTDSGFLKPQHITPQKIAMIQKLNDLAKARGQTLAQMALAWVLRYPAVTSVLIGASKPEQIAENVAAIHAAPFT
ncbi:MAG TPA: aldo/keto reductase, partial [Phycisphaerae bacterium]